MIQFSKISPSEFQMFLDVCKDCVNNTVDSYQTLFGAVPHNHSETKRILDMLENDYQIMIASLANENGVCFYDQEDHDTISFCYD